MSANIEQGLLYFSQEVARCIKDPAVVSHLSASGVVTQDDGSRIKNLYLSGDSFKANEEMTNCLLKSRARGKWRSFLDALEQSEYHYLKTLLESSGRASACVERAREIIRIFTPYLEDTINGKDIVTELYSKKVINQRDQELFLTTCQNKGETYATIVLLERMQCRLPPNEWYYHFLAVLVDKGYQHIVTEIEPDFLECPDHFKPERSRPTDTKFSKTNEKISSEMFDAEHDEACCSSSGNVEEHIMTDVMDVEEDMDDQGIPTPVEDDECGHGSVDASQTCNLKDLDATYSRPVCDMAKTEKDVGYQEKLSESPPTLGERIPPEGQDLNVSSSCVSLETSEKTTRPEMETNESEVKQDEMSCISNTEMVSNQTTADIGDPGGASDHTQQPLDQKLYTYQLELAEKALAGKNTIICAPTGSGKTWVALYIIDRHLRSSKNGIKKVAFMANHGVLVQQQVDRLSTELTYARVRHLVGTTEEAQMMKAFIEDADIFFFTPQILVNNLDKDIKSLSIFSLLVFDECHHTIGGQPYNTLMKKYLLEKSEGIKSLPQIVGLTASMGTGRAKSAEDALEHIFLVCANLDVRCLSLVEKNKEDLAKHVSLPKEETISMKKRIIDPCRGILLEALREMGDLLTDEALLVPKLIQIMHNRPKEIESRQYGSWTAKVVKEAETLPNGQGRDIASCAKYLQIYYNALEVNKLLRTQDVAFYIATKHSQEAENQDSLTQIEKRLLHKLRDIQKDLMMREKNDNPNIQVISKLLSGLFAEEDENSRAMVFVHARATSRALADHLNETLAEIFVKASPLLGKEKRGTDKGMTEEEQTRVINDFRDGTLKVLVATSVGMEGLDVPDCNMILNYSFTANDITKIQMPGRSRKEGGKSVMIATDTQVQKDKIAMYRIKLMHAAVDKFTHFDNNAINREIISIQKKELDKYKWMLKTRDLKRSKQSDEEDYEIRCRTCGVFVCNASDVRRYETSYLVALKDFEGKIRRKEHTQRQNMGVFKKNYKMFCVEKCSNDWGIIAVKDELEYYVLKLENLKIVSCADENDVKTYKKWIEVPYKFKDICVEDLSVMYDDDNI